MTVDNVIAPYHDIGRPCQPLCFANNQWGSLFNGTITNFCLDTGSKNIFVHFCICRFSFQIFGLKLFQTFCICVVLYLSYQQCLEYAENQDSSSVSYRFFNEDIKDVYPTFSICLYSGDGGILNEDVYDFGVYGIDEVENYHTMLVGMSNITEDFVKIDFDKNTLDIIDNFVDLSVSHTRQNIKVDNKEMSLFYKSYQDPYFNCITKSSYYVKNQLFTYDYLLLNSSKILHYMENLIKNNKSVNMYVYIHHPGQLIEEFGKQILELQKLDFEKAIKGSPRNKNNYREVHLSHVEVLRKRPDSFIPCDENLQSEDALWLGKVIENVKCVPTYWVGLKGQLDVKNYHLPICNSSLQYLYTHNNFLPPNHFENGLSLYEGQGSCNQMQTMLSVSTKESPISPDDQRMIIGFQHARAKYRETINIKKFGNN